jgi:hypothetical protein
MNRFLKPAQAVLLLAFIATLTSCTLGQAAEPTPTAVDVNAVMTSAASTAFAQLTQIAGQASPTSAPTETLAPTETQASPNTPDPGQPTAQQAAQITDTPMVILELSPTLPGLPEVPTMTPVPIVATPNPGQVCNNSSFVADMTIPDGTAFKAWEKFTKIWRIKNTGFCAWDDGYGIINWNGPALAGDNKFFSPGEYVQPGGEVDMVIKMYAPGEPGDYISHWVMVNDQGQTFGTDLVVYIKVVK